MVGAIGACGFGFGAILFGFVESLPWRWRALYAVGVFPLLLMPRLRSGISETPLRPSPPPAPRCGRDRWRARLARTAHRTRAQLSATRARHHARRHALRRGRDRACSVLRLLHAQHAPLGAVAILAHGGRRGCRRHARQRPRGTPRRSLRTSPGAASSSRRAFRFWRGSSITCRGRGCRCCGRSSPCARYRAT